MEQQGKGVVMEDPKGTYGDQAKCAFAVSVLED